MNKQRQFKSPCSNYDGVFKQIDLSHYQSQLSNLQYRIQSINDINIKESAEFGGNLKNKISEINERQQGKMNKSNFSSVNNLTNFRNENQEKYFTNHSDKENYSNINIQKEDKNITISRILERMNGRFDEIESKMEKISQASQMNQQINNNNQYQKVEGVNSSEYQKNQQIEVNILSKLLDRVEQLEKKIDNYDAGFVNYKKQMESNLNNFMNLIQKSITQFMEKSEQIEKKMGIVQVKINNENVIKQNYETIIERLNKINMDFNERFSNVESQTHRKEEQISQEVFFQQERLNKLEREIGKVVILCNENVDKNNGNKWMSDEINYLKNRQVQFLTMLMEISTLVGIK